MQHDLFESPVTATGPATLGQNPQKLDFLSSLRMNLRLDQIVVVLIGLLAFYAVVYSIGVEKGKQIAAAEPRISVSPLKEDTQAPPPAPQVLMTYGTLEMAPAEGLASTTARAKPSGSYTIQMATYKTQSAAEKQVSKLTKLGHQAFVVPDGSLRLVCLDGFGSRQEASRALIGLKTRGMVPRDAFIRPLPQ